MTLIGLMGDVHGNINTVAYGMKLFKEQGISAVIQAGDFGFWPGDPGQKYLNQVSEVLTDNEQFLLEVPGNHEDYNQLKHLSKDESGMDIVRSRIRVAPRGHRWEWDFCRSYVPHCSAEENELPPVVARRGYYRGRCCQDGRGWIRRCHDYP